MQQGNLPGELSSFIGRDRELLEIRRLLAVVPTVTLTGPGGIGKSRLGLRAAHQFARHFPDGVWMIELAELDSPDLLIYAVARALEVYERPGVAIEDAIVAHLQGRRLLLVLDNCETVLDACGELVSSIVSRTGGVRFLCTSRQRLGIAGETIVVVSPLEVPAEADGLSISALGGVEALKLLVERASAVAPDFALTEDNGASATGLCQRLDGMPLAIELAAVRLASMTPADLLARLDDRFRLLTEERGHQSRRHRALRATVEWSHDLLGEEEKILWRRLSVFAGSFGIEAAEAVCSGEGLDRERVLDVIVSLVDKSILTMGQGGGHSRYRLLETMRLYGTERLREADEVNELRRRHAGWYVELITAAELPWRGAADQADISDWLDVEWANVEAALDFCAESPSDAEMGLRVVADLWWYWTIRGRYGVGRRHVGTFLAIVPAASETRAMALWAIGFLEQATSDLDAAVASFEEGGRVSAQTGGARELAYSQFGLGLVRLRRGEQQAAVEVLVASRDALKQVGDHTGVALSSYFLATAYAAAGKLTDALGLAQEGRDLSGAAGNAMVGGITSTLLGIVEWQLGHAPSAATRLEEAVRLQHRIGHRWGLVTSLDALAWVAASSGQFERASLLRGAVASLWEELGITPIPYWQGHRDACEGEIRAGLDEVQYQAHWKRGFALDRAQQVALAFADDVPASPMPAAGRTPGDSFALTARELEVARLVGDGLSNPAIAATLFISVATAKTHVSHILTKLALDSRVQLANWVAANDPGPARPAHE